MKMLHDELASAEERIQYQQAYDELSNALTVTLRLGKYLLTRAMEACPENRDGIDGSAFMQIIEFFDMIDGVSVLIKAGASSSCVPLLRTAFEMFLNIAYLTEDVTKYEQRSLDYEYWHMFLQLDCVDRFDPTTNKGSDIKRLLENDHFFKEFDTSEFCVDVDTERKRIQAIMNKPRFMKTKDEYERMQKENRQGKGPNNWFGLWNGPTSIRNLAVKLGSLSMYEALYRHWSTTAHGEAAHQRNHGIENGVTYIRPLRSPNGLPSKTQHAVNLTNFVIQAIRTRYVPDLGNLVKAEYLEVLKPAYGAIHKYALLDKRN